MRVVSLSVFALLLSAAPAWAEGPILDPDGGEGQSPTGGASMDPAGRVLAGPALREFTDPEVLGPYGVGVTEVLVEARHQDAPLETLIWYPADVRPGVEPYVYIEDPELGGPLTSLAVQDAALHVESEPYPIIVFSHGNGGINCQSIFMMEHLASHGYVLISANHPGNTLYDYQVTSLATGVFTRPRDISALLDYIIDEDNNPASAFYGHLDTRRIGMSGHSFGGYTTLAVSGAQLNLSAPAQRCAARGDAWSCAVTAEARRLRLGDRMIDLSDDRVIASAPLAPWGWEPFREEGLAELDIPLQIHGGSLDDTCPYETQQVPVYENVSVQKGLLNVIDAGHYAWSDYCLAFPDFEECHEPYVPNEVAHPTINTYVMSHFKVFLELDTRYTPYLSAEYAASLGGQVTWMEELGL